MRNRSGTAAQRWLRAMFACPLVSLLCMAVLVPLLAAGPAAALQPIVVSPDDERAEVTALGEIYEGRGDTLQVETVAGADGAVSRMAVRALTPGTNPNWIVFALTNPTDKPVERWLTADRYNLIGSGTVWPDLDAKRIEAVTPSFGFIPERLKSERADVFRLTLEPGQTITYVAELSSERFSRIYLWKPIDYELKIRDRQLLNGVLLGLTGLLAIFLTAIFAANHKLVFPASALVAWCALVYLCVDFGFFHKLFQLKPEDNAVYRAASEAGLAASLVIFVHIFLRLALWHGLVRMLVSVWMLAQLALIAVAIIDPRLAATFARLSFLAIGGIGAAFTLFLALRGQDRALSLIPTWILFLVWIFGAGMALMGRLSGDMVVSGLVAGLVLILLLIGFTVTQYAFRSIEPVYGTSSGELQMRSLALDGAGAAIWEWSSRRDEIKTGPEIETALGLAPGELSVKSEEFGRHLHPADRERFRVLLWSIQERSDGRMRADFRMRHSDNSYRWFEIEAARIPGSDPRSFRCVGLMRDVTGARRAHERLVNNAIYCSLTGLPNRALLADRLAILKQRARSGGDVRPQVISIGIDKFSSANTSFGMVVGDSLLLTVARRLQRYLNPEDTLARVGGDQFAIVVAAGLPEQELLALAERIRRSLRSPIKIAGQEVVLTGSLGLASLVPGDDNGDLLKDAEIAMYRAKRAGADRVEVFNPAMRADSEDRIAIEADLRKAIEKHQIKVLYMPIVYMPTEELAGFEAIVRWEHPKHGTINPAAFEPATENSDIVVKLGSQVLMRAARNAAVWQKALPRSDTPLFITVNVSEKEMLRQDLIQEIRHILGRSIVPKGTLKLEVNERLVMENPEQASEVLEWLRGAGAEVALDGFGSGFTSLAYLQRFPIDSIKVDPALIEASGAEDGSGSVILRSTVALAHELGKKVIAQGVVFQEEAAFLRSIGCEYAQGPYFGGAHSEAEVLQLLKQIRKSESKLQPRGLFKSKAKKVKVANGSGNETAAPGANGNGTPPPSPSQTAPQMPPPMPLNGGENRGAPVNGAPDGFEIPYVNGYNNDRGAEPFPGLAAQSMASQGMMPPNVTPESMAHGGPFNSQPDALAAAGLDPLAPNPLVQGGATVFPTGATVGGTAEPSMGSTQPPPIPAFPAMPPPISPMDVPAGPSSPAAAMPPPLPQVAAPGFPPPPVPPMPSQQPIQFAPPPQAPAIQPDPDPLPRFLDNGHGVSATSGKPARPQSSPPPDFSSLPPSIAASLARLAGK